jgi:hypothetical protein
VEYNKLDLSQDLLTLDILMKTMIYRLFIVVSFILSGMSLVFAQSGTYFMTHYNPAEHNFDNSNYSILQDDRGVMHIANRQGVLHYDGNAWWLTPTPYSIFCLAKGNGQMYVGGREGFGIISQTGSGEEKFSSIDSLHYDISQCLVLGNTVYYINDHHLFKFNIKTPGKVETVVTVKQEILDLVKVRERIYITTTEGLREITDSGISEPELNYPNGAYFIRESKNGSLLYLTDSSHIYTDIDGVLKELTFENKRYLEDHTITEILWATDSLIAISTLSGGILFVNVPSGQTEQIVDYNTGLPDNQINEIYTDDSGGFWALHSFGLSVISLNLPLRGYNHYPGLEGALISVLPYKKSLYVGTTLGVYKLTKKKEIRKSVVYERVRLKVEDEDTDKEEKIVEKKGLFGFFKKKNRKKPPVLGKEENSPKYKYVYRKRIVEEEISSHYEFVKVKGINAKSGQFLAYKNQLLAGTVHGAYSIENDTAVLVNAVPVLSMYGLPNNNMLFISTIDEEVKVLELRSKSWRETKMLEGLTDYIDQITLDPENNIWLCGADSLYRFTVDGSNLGDVEVYKIENPHFERVYSVNYNGKIHFINSSGYYAYQDRQIRKQDYLEEEIGLAKKYVLGQNGELWINTGSKWYGENQDIRKSLNFLSLFKDPQSVAHDDSNNFWVITAANDLYKIDTKAIANISGKESIYLKEVRNNDKRIPIVAEMEVGQEGSSLTFEFASPDYSGIYRKEYQFRLSTASGTQSQWSNWSANNNVISYQFLSPGAYLLEARYRNSLGTILDAKPFKFIIVPPYWKRPWFYVLELLFFGSLLAFTFYLNRGKSKFTFMSRLLGFLTLILIVEFFQTVAEYKFETNDSPVINFFIQAFIALMILPIEGILRKLLTKAPEPNPGKGKLKD